jgi:RNA polymerase sigma-70 factor (ECF subfamily)
MVRTYKHEAMEFDAVEQAAFVAQITRHQSMLRSYIIALMPGVDGVDDVLQQTNLVLWKKRTSFQTGTNFRAWASAIARFEVMAHRRKMLRFSKLMMSEELSEMLARHCEEPPDEVDERLRALDKCLGRLRESERELLEHRYFSKGTLDDFAARCMRPPESLKVTLFRIRAALRKCINSELAIDRARL